MKSGHLEPVLCDKRSHCSVPTATKSSPHSLLLANLENSAVATGLEKVSFHSNPKAMPKQVQTTAQLHSSHTLAE